MPAPDLSTPYLARLARRLMSALAAFGAWLSKHPWPAVARYARRAKANAGRLVRWLDRFLSVNKRDLALYAGLALAGVGLGLRYGPWLGFAVPGSIIALVAVFGVAPVKDDKPSSRS